MTIIMIWSMQPARNAYYMLLHYPYDRKIALPNSWTKQCSLAHLQLDLSQFDPR
jgi:hypothetical protein